MSNLNFSDKMHYGYKGSDPNNIKLSVIIPARNEAKRIRPTLKFTDKYLEKQPYMYEIIVVDNESTDNTVDVVKSYKNEVEHSAVYNITACPGKGCAVQRGILHSRGDYVVFLDADNSTRIDEMDKAWKKFDEGYDVVIGSRRISGAKIATKQPWIRELAGRVANLMIRVLVVRGITDTQCGFKVFTKKAARDIFSAVTIGRWGFDIEVLALARKWKYKIAEIPVTWHHYETELIKGSSYINTLSDLLKIKWNLITGKYDKLRGDKTAKDRFASKK
ncbi:MAG: glycosyl transferase family 2 [uncultured bacterium]|nr:MAG: glycosyl transferase family 2 [uncultured bacterium]